ncbi:MAG: hypothetical protein R2909_23755 [Gemmatimonadales bacterium]
MMLRGDAGPRRLQRESPANLLATELAADGVELDEIALDDLAIPSDIEAIEVYRSSAQVPARFGGTGAATQCGVIVVDPAGWRELRANSGFRGRSDPVQPDTVVHSIASCELALRYRNAGRSTCRSGRDAAAENFNSFNTLSHAIGFRRPEARCGALILPPRLNARGGPSSQAFGRPWCIPQSGFRSAI